jgi:hypothetical protein
MKKLTFQNLVSLAREESHPEVHVADDVISTLKAMVNRELDPYLAFTWIGTASAAIAAGILIFSMILWQSNTNSVNEIMSYVSWVAQ